MSPVKIFDFFASLRLSVVVLSAGIVLVFWGTYAQVKLGLFKAQLEFFRSFFIYWQPGDSGLKIPIFPGGYLVGLVMLLNLLAGLIKTWAWTRAKFGLVMVHGGIILLLVGQLATDMLSVESTMRIREGQSSNYSELDRYCELAVINVTDKDKDRLVAIPQDVLAREEEIRHPELPFTIKINRFFPNSTVGNRRAEDTSPPVATQGFGPQATVNNLPRETQMNRRDMSSVVIELVTPKGSLGTWLVSYWIEQEQHLEVDGKDYHLILRPQRLYKPYSLYLEDFRHETYPGTEIPKDFSSRVRLKNPSSGEDREVRIYMNNPLRYQGETYYQSGFDPDNKGTSLQVVRNPSWLTPYFACVLVAVGLVMQFLSHLIPFLRRKLAS